MQLCEIATSNLKMKLKKRWKTWGWRSLFSSGQYWPQPGLSNNFIKGVTCLEAEQSPQLVAWRKSEEPESQETSLNSDNRIVQKRLPQRSMSLSPGWRIGDSEVTQELNDEVELFLEKYVLPLQEGSSLNDDFHEHDSGHHSLDTNSARSTINTTKFRKQMTNKKSDTKSKSKLVTIVNINGDVTTFKTVCKTYREKSGKVSRSKTLPSQAGFYRNNLKISVNGAGSLNFIEPF